MGQGCYKKNLGVFINFWLDTMTFNKFWSVLKVFHEGNMPLQTF